MKVNLCRSSSSLRRRCCVVWYLRCRRFVRRFVVVASFVASLSSLLRRFVRRFVVVAASMLLRCRFVASSLRRRRFVVASSLLCRFVASSSSLRGFVVLSFRGFVASSLCCFVAASFSSLHRRFISVWSLYALLSLFCRFFVAFLSLFCRFFVAFCHVVASSCALVSCRSIIVAGSPDTCLTSTVESCLQSLVSTSEVPRSTPHHAPLPTTSEGAVVSCEAVVVHKPCRR
mgnify:CR=1 FL=1